VKPQVVSFHCVMKNRLGQVLSSSFNRDVVNRHDVGRERLPGLVDGLQSVRAGEKRTISLAASEAYGRYDPGLVVEVRRSTLEYSDQLALGSQVMRRSGRTGQMRLFRVTELSGALATLDGNHPLAGQDLVFEVEVISARDARAEELDEYVAGPLLQ
jgi:FKBP-type peptidyl-prolyl cis-trans isomerase SlyD